MKYIRTKDDKIVDVTDFEEFVTDDDKNEGKYVFDGLGKDGVYYPAEEIVKMGEELWFLCDYVVLSSIYSLTGTEVILSVNPSSLFYVALAKAQFLAYKDELNLRLALLTDKGLIYVAKMNEKGELELL